MTPHAYLDAQQPRIEQLLQTLVQIPTVNPPGNNYAQIVEVLTRRCQDLDLSVAIHLVPEQLVRTITNSESPLPRYNVVARWDVGATETVHFNAHYDVVPAAGEWRFGSPFEPGMTGGMMYGRGTSDMKGSIAALLMAIESLRRTGREPAVNIECSFTADEETGGELGAGYLVRTGLIDADYAVVCEGASGTSVGCGHNGVLWLQVEVVGKSAHAANPGDGVNAFEGMMQIADGLSGLKKELGSSGKRFVDFNGTERVPTLNIGGVFGGSAADKINTVPGRAHFSIDRRIPPSEVPVQVERELRETIGRLAKRRSDLRVKTDTRLRIAPCVVEPGHRLPASFARALQAVRRHPAGFRCSSGFTDLHYFVVEGGLPGIGFGVGGQNVHGVNERLRVRDLVQTTKVYIEFMLRGVE